MSTVPLRELLHIFERAVPPQAALEGDPIGLHVGDPSQPISKVMTALEVTGPIIDQAEKAGAELLLVHHPLIFSPLKRLTERGAVERLTARLIRSGIALYAMHTNLDLHPQGMGLTWCRRLGLQDPSPVLPPPKSSEFKIVTFVPESHLERVREALARAGAGRIGDYDTCSFAHPGTGSFRGGERSKPFAGQAGCLEFEAEQRLEMVVPAGRVSPVVTALAEAHPYEEPAYDLIRLADFRDLAHAVWTGGFEKGLPWDAFLSRVSKSIPGFTGARASTPPRRTRIRRVALSTGSGSSCLPVAMGLDVDAYLTGELGYHLFWEAREMGFPVVAVGHYESERFFSETVKRILRPMALPVSLLQAREKPPATVVS